MDVGSKVTAIYDFDTTEPGELSLRAGDCVEIISKVDENWLTGSCNGKSGAFPANFVKLVEGNTANLDGGAGSSQVVAVQDFEGAADGDLSFKKGDVIQVTHQIDEHWMQGCLGNKTGIFPTSYVTSTANSHPPTSQHSSQGVQAEAIQNNTGQLSDELTFKIGDIITITEKVDDDWLRGTLGNKSGVLPAMCVKILETSVSNGPRADVPGSTNNAFQANSTSVNASTVNRTADKPCAKALYPFSAERDCELSFMDGENIELRKRIDENWLEGELDGNVGLFPAAFVEVIVDIPEGYVPPEVTPPKCTKVDTNTGNSMSSQGDVAVVKPQLLDVGAAGAGKGTQQWKGRRAKVLYDFNPETEHDLVAKQGEIVTILTKPDNEWFEAKNPAGKAGFIPIAYVQVLEKPRTPSFKRQAPQPPGVKPSVAPSKKGAAPKAPPGVHSDKNANNVLSLDQLENRGSRKPNLPTKPNDTAQSSGVVGDLDDLLFFDPLVGAAEPLLLPTSGSSGTKDASLPHAFVPGGSVFKPVSFSGKASTTTAAVAPMSSGSPSATPPPQPGRVNSLMDMSPIDKPMSPLLQPMVPSDGSMAPSEPAAKPQVTKQDSQDSLSKFDVLAARPFNAASSKQFRSVQRPMNKGFSSGSIDASAAILESAAPMGGSESVPSEEGASLLTISQINQDLDRAMLEGNSPNSSVGSGLLTLSQINSDLDKVMQEGPDVGSNVNAAFSGEMDSVSQGPTAPAPQSDYRPPVPPRQPSPNPFAHAVQEQEAETTQSDPTMQTSSNPFSAVTPPEEFETGFANSFDPLQSVCDSSEANIPRDDSVPSDMSDDAFANGINFTINSPQNIPQNPQTSAFKLPPPPSPGKRTAAPGIPPKPQKFDPRTAVPRPRPRTSIENMEPLVAPAGSKPVPAAKPDHLDLLSSEAPANPDLANFEASIQHMFDTSQWETDGTEGPDAPSQPAPPPPVTRGASLLEQDLGVIGHVLQQQSAAKASSSQAPVGDLLGIGGVIETPPAQANKPSRPAPPRPAQAAKKKAPPGRPTPPKIGPSVKKEEDEMLAHLRPEAAVNGDSELADTIKALECSIAEIRSDIEKQRLQKNSLVRECAFVTGEDDKAELQQQISDIEGNIEHLESEVQSLEEQLAEVRPEPIQVPKMTPADFRESVVKELLKTEGDYVRDIKLCQEGFMTVLQENQELLSNILIAQAEEEMTRTGEKKVAKGLELDILFGNMEQVIEVAEKFLNDLELTVNGKTVEEQLIGKVFMDNCKSLHEAYAQYCRNHDDASALLERYEENPDVQEYINQGLELVRQSTNCWDLASFLIKPVQRILKYHLLLAELYKYTDEDHQDKETLKIALATMTEVATDINEFKRRKDLVMKYRRTGQEAISDKLGKLNLHSIRKKSQRMNQRFTQMAGLGTQTVDNDFEKAERRFINLEKTIKIFVKDVHAYLEQLKEATSVEATVGSDISDYYANQSNLHEVNKYEAVQRHLANKLYKDYTLFVQQRVMSPLNSLLIMFQGPQKLIQKRHDKLLDYDSYINKAEKMKDKDKVKQVKDDKEVARKNYEALNVQLKDELPQLCGKAMALFKSCIISFIEAERDHINSTLKKLYPLLELSIVRTNNMTSIMSDFETSHQTASEGMMVFQFVPRNFDRRVEKSDKKSARKSYTQPSVPASKPPTSKAQSDTQRQSVLTRYPAGRVFQVKANFIAEQPMDISVYKGNVVGIIKEQDPTGSSDRWYVDSGASQGFLPCGILVPCNNEGQLTSPLGEYGSDDDANRRGVYSDLSSPQYYYAEWAFMASSPNEVSLTEGAVVTVIAAQDSEGNSEWWLVEKDGQRGYVPSTYLAKV